LALASARSRVTRRLVCGKSVAIVPSSYGLLALLLRYYHRVCFRRLRASLDVSLLLHVWMCTFLRVCFSVASALMREFLGFYAASALMRVFLGFSAASALMRVFSVNQSI